LIVYGPVPVTAETVHVATLLFAQPLPAESEDGAPVPKVIVPVPELALAVIAYAVPKATQLLEVHEPVLEFTVTWILSPTAGVAVVGTVSTHGCT
jgi:hypothetical protein